MRKLLAFLLPVLAISCNNNSGTDSKGTTKDTTSKSSSATAMDYPYKIDHPDNWEIGSTSNTMTVLKSLKAWEDGKMDESAKYFADSVLIGFDGPERKMTNDSLKSMFTQSWNEYKTVKVNMKDWESVIAKDKSEEWVTIWYVQNWETKKGVVDSASVINDAMLKDGKIKRLYEYTRKLH